MNQPIRPNASWRPLLWWSAIGLLLRLAYAAWLGEDLVVGDAAEYLREAQHWLAGRPLPPYWPPGLPWLLLPGLALSGGHPAGAVATMLLLYLLSNGLLFRLLPARHPRLRAFFLALFALLPVWVHHSVLPLTQLPVAVLGLLLLGLLRQGRDLSWRQVLAVGLLLGAMALIRPASLTLLPLALGWLGWQQRQTWRATAWVLLGLGLLLLPWELHLRQRTGRWIWINEANSRNLFLGNHPAAPDYRSWWLGSHDARQDPRMAGFYAEQDSVYALPQERQAQAFRQLALADIREAPGRFLLRMTHRLRTFWAFDSLTAGFLQAKSRGLAFLVLLLDALGYWLLLAGAVYAYARPRHPFSRATQGLLLGFMLGYPLPYLLAFSHPTYHLPLLPLLALLASGAPHPLFTPVEPRNWRWARYLIGAGLVFVQLEWLSDLISRGQ